MSLHACLRARALAASPLSLQEELFVPHLFRELVGRIRGQILFHLRPRGRDTLPSALSVPFRGAMGQQVPYVVG
eukprot:5140135-Alexandrium_andersonii.AAC.1